jgi:L-iditol 2-dehydrogenase
MRAQVFHGPGDLRLEEVAVRPPGTGEVTLKIEAALTCGTDVKTLRRGHPVMIPHLPTVFGHEFAGTVSAVGAGVTRLRDGDRVVAANSAPCGDCRPCIGGRPNLCDNLLFVNGAYAEFITLPSRIVARNLVKMGDRVPARRAAFVEPLACALLAIERARVEVGQTVVVFGHGPLGCLLAMAVTARKARAIVVGKPGWRLERVRSLGIGDCLDAGGGPDVLAAVREAAGTPVDVTIDATGKPEVWEQAVDAVDRGGNVVFFGGCAPGTSVRLGTRRIHYEELSLLGAFHHTPEMIRRAVDLIESGSIVPDGLLTHRMGLANVRDALQLMENGQALKVLIEP